MCDSYSIDQTESWSVSDIFSRDPTPSFPLDIDC